MEYESADCAFGTITKGLLKGLGSWRTGRDYPNDSNPETNPGDLRIGLVSLFNGISTLFRLFNAKAILLEEQ